MCGSVLGCRHLLVRDWYLVVNVDSDFETGDETRMGDVCDDCADRRYRSCNVCIAGRGDQDFRGDYGATATISEWTDPRRPPISLYHPALPDNPKNLTRLDTTHAILLFCFD